MRLLRSVVCLIVFAALGASSSSALAAVPPSPAFKSPFPETPTQSTSATIHFRNIAPDATDVECSLNEGVFAACSSWVAGATSGSHALSGLSDGDQVLVVRQTNPDGQASSAISWTVDTTAPSGPVFSVVPSDPSGNTTPSFSWSGELSSVFKCSVDDADYVDAFVCTSGYVASSLPEGSHTFRVWEIDEAGNVTPAPASYAWSIDLTPPGAPTISDQPNDPDNSTTPSFSFSGEAGASFRCSVDDADYMDAVACSSPYVTDTLAEGSHVFRVWQIDASGNAGSEFDSYSWEIDLTPAGPPSITDQPSNPDNSATPSFSFSGEAGASFRCSVDDANYMDSVACSSPHTTDTLAEGSHTFRVWQIDPAGNPSLAAADYSWEIDLTNPTAPSVDTGPANPDNQTSPTFTFSGEAGASFICTIDGDLVDAVSCSSPFAPAASVADGLHTFKVWQTDQAGNTSALPGTWAWIADVTPPGSPSITAQPSNPSTDTTPLFSFSGDDGASFRCSVDDADYGDAVPCTSPFATDTLSEGSHIFRVWQVDEVGNPSASPADYSWEIDLTAPSTPTITDQPVDPSNDTTPSFSFSGEAGASFRCSVDDADYEDAASCSSPYTSSTLSAGSHVFRVWQIDQAGNPSAAAADYTWELDLESPATPTITDQPADPSNDTTPSFSFSGEAGASFRCLVDDADYANAVACTSPYTTDTLSDGSHTFRVWQIDQAGNVSSEADAYTWSLDLSAPDAPVFISQPDEYTQSTSASIGFSAEPGATFECALDTGAYSACVSPLLLSSLTEGQHTVHVKAKDAAGNLSDAAAVSWTIDGTEPSAPTIADQPADPDNNTTPEFSFSGENGASFICSIDHPSVVWATPCTSPYLASTLAAGTHTFRVWQIDQAGNQSVLPDVYTWTLDLETPASPNIDAKPAAVDGDATPSFSFSGEAGASFRCSVDDADYEDSTSCSSPYTSSALSEGSHAFRVWQIDQAGNESENPELYTWEIDLTPPAVPVLEEPNPGPSNDATPTFSFSGEEGNTFRCSVDDADYEDSIACSSPYTLATLAEGSHAFRVWQVDSSGNHSEPTEAFVWTVDLSAPSTPVFDSQPGEYDNDPTPAFSFSGETGSSYRCSVDSSLLADAIACSSPYTLETLAAGAHTFRVWQIDEAGNTSTAAAAYSWTLDLQTPAAPVFTTTPSDPDGDATPTFTFTGEAGASFRCSVDSSSFAAATACSSPYTSSSLAAGAHTFRVWQIDRAGNPSTTAASHAWQLVLGTPAVPTITDKPALWSNDSSPSFVFSGSAGNTFRCSLDNASFAAATTCSSPKTYAAVYEGPHVFRVWQINAVGTPSAAPAAYTWTVDLTAPDVAELTGKPTNPSNDQTPTFTFSGESRASFRCSIDDSSFVSATACTSPYTTPSLAYRSHVFRVWQLDRAGNPGPALAYSWTLETVCPAPATPTGSVATALNRRDGKWYLSVGAKFRAADATRSCAQLSLVQINESISKPSNSLPFPTAVNVSQGVLSWQSTVSRKSSRQPRWVRVGSRAGKWTGWVGVTRTR